jgi:hypothetical protein
MCIIQGSSLKYRELWLNIPNFMTKNLNPRSASSVNNVDSGSYLTRMQMGVADERFRDNLIGGALQVSLVAPVTAAKVGKTRQHERYHGGD